MHPDFSLLWLIFGGILSGVLAGFMGIGGGSVMVPLLVVLGYSTVEAVATSSLAILIISISGTFQNWRMGFFDLKRVLALGTPAAVMAFVGSQIANFIPSFWLLVIFGLLMYFNIYLVSLRRGLAQTEGSDQKKWNPTTARILTGGVAGMVAGLVGVGGGVIMVPLQMLLLREAIKVAIQTSLGVVVLTAVFAVIGHAFHGHVLVIEGLILGAGGLLGAQFSTRFLPKLSDAAVSSIFSIAVALLGSYALFQAWKAYAGI
ncbi:MAG: sulfite exporter TauE/SafE family protein [Anaerolineae bacterium]|nr:sulfite exporter TauE/SafE family protein [Gloeobacterales cyanobacterium ES-bin-313]